MSVVVIGLNHRTAPLELLERMVIGDVQMSKALHDLTTCENLSEAVVLSTCTRTEVYAVAERFHGAFSDIRNFLGDMSFLPPEDFADHLYVHYDSSAAAHLFAVTSGLDSVVLGESEIQGQVKHAWEHAHEEGTAGKTLNLLFRHALQAGKRARTETGIARNIASVSQAAVAMATQRLGALAGKSVLVLGAGDMGEGMVTALVGAGVSEVRVANRTRSRADDLAARVGGRSVALLDLPDHVAEVDVLLTSTGSRTLMLEVDDLAPVMRTRPDRPLLIVDIAMPRDVDAAVGGLEGVTLLDMDDLRSFAEQGVAERRREVGRVEAILEEELHGYLDATSAREVAPIVVALRGRAEATRQAELDRFRNRLSSLGPAELDAVEALSKSLVAKLLHEPTVVLKSAAGSSRGDRLLAALRELFGIEV
ncbi:MAG TPA: glutamyl-tRNA reductase [Acidimicrobiales bacterium]|nr:glutamyl-tRNA reductase [Acidimicrobiales bacterium]